MGLPSDVIADLVGGKPIVPPSGGSIQRIQTSGSHVLVPTPPAGKWRFSNATLTNRSGDDLTVDFLYDGIIIRTDTIVPNAEAVFQALSYDTDSADVTMTLSSAGAVDLQLTVGWAERSRSGGYPAAKVRTNSNTPVKVLDGPLDLSKGYMLRVSLFGLEAPALFVLNVDSDPHDMELLWSPDDGATFVLVEASPVSAGGQQTFTCVAPIKPGESLWLRSDVPASTEEPIVQAPYVEVILAP